MEKIPAPGRCCSEWPFTSSAWSSNMLDCLHLYVYDIPNIYPFLKPDNPSFSLLPNAIASKFSPFISHPFSLWVYLSSCLFLSLFCFLPLKVKFLYQCFGTCSSGLCLVDILLPKWVDLKPFIVISQGSVGWFGLAGHFTLGSLHQLKSDAGWSRSHLRSWLSRTPKMAHSGGWQLRQAVGWEFS